MDPETVGTAESTISATPGVLGIEEFRLRWIGRRLRAEAGVVVDCSDSVVAGHEIAEEVRHRLLHALPKLEDATVHVSPCSHEGRDHHAALAHHFTTVT